jgi:hypothetical protein
VANEVLLGRSDVGFVRMTVLLILTNTMISPHCLTHTVVPLLRTLELPHRLRESKIT